MLGLLPKKPKEYWDALAKKYPSNDESFVRGIPSQLLATRVIYRLIALYPGLLKHVKDVSALSPIQKGVQIVGDVTSFGLNPVIRTVTDKVLIPIVKGCRQEELDLLSPSAMGTIDKYIGSSHSVMISESEHATIVKKQPDGTYLHFNSHGVTREDKLIKKLQNFVGPDKTLVHSTCPRFQGTRGVCLLWSLLFIVFPEKSGDELWKMLNAAHERQQIFEHPFARAMPLYVKDVSSDLILIAMFENFVEMTDRKLDELPPSIKAKLRTALGGRRKTRRVKNRRGGGPWSPHDYLYEGSMSGNLDWVRKGIADGANVNEQYIHGTNLIFASRKGYTEIVRALLAAGANPNIPRYDNDMTPLIASATYGPGYTEIGRLLIAAGANVNAVTKQNFTALWSAAERGNVEMVRDLLAAGADQTIKPDDGTTVYDIAKTQEIRDLLVPSAPPAASPPPTPIDIPSDREDPITLEPFVEGEKVGCFPNSNPRIRTMCYKLSSIQGLIERIGYDGLIKNPETREKFPLSAIIYGIAHLVPPVGGKRRTRRKHRKHKSKTGKRKTRK